MNPLHARGMWLRTMTVLSGLVFLLTGCASVVPDDVKSAPAVNTASLPSEDDDWTQLKTQMRIDLNRYPYEMSGGQQQLVSIMRALVVDPEILFLDEPFSALDYEMTLFMREQLQRIFMDTGTTTMIVSHDLEEAVYLADRILLLTRAPSRVADFVSYDAVRPRTDETLSDPAFIRVKSHCLEVFQREVRK